MTKSFEARLMAKGPGGAWTYLPIPFDVQQAFGSRSRVAVMGTLNGFPFRNSLMPEGDGTHSMMVGKDLQAGAGARAGDLVAVTLQPDTEARTVSIPPDLAAALLTHAEAGRVFETMTHAQKKEYADWIASAKQEATRLSRVGKALELLAAGKKRLR